MGGRLLRRAMGFVLWGLVALGGDVLPEMPRGPAGEIGDPFLRVFTPRDYQGFYQNWSMVQDPRGMVYVGNNLGVLEFDGSGWRLIRTPQGALVRALAVDDAGQVLVGTGGDLGVLQGNADGDTQFVSRLSRLDPGTRDFTEIIGAAVVGEAAYYLALERLLEIRPTGVRSWKARTRFQELFHARGRVFVQAAGDGLLTLASDRLAEVPGIQALRGDAVRGVLPWEGGGPDGLVLVTEARGLFRWDGQKAVPWRTGADPWLAKTLVLAARSLGDGTLVLATRSEGLLRISPTGAFLGGVLPGSGLPVTAIHNIGQDAHGGLWLVLGKGLCRAELPSPLSRFDEQRGLRGAIFAIHRHRGSLYVGTEQGAFRLVPGPQPQFRPVAGVKGAVWAFHSDGEQLYLAAHAMLFRVEGTQAKEVWKASSPIYGIWPSSRVPGRIYLGLHRGLQVLARTGNGWQEAGSAPELGVNVRSLVEAEDGSLWLGTAVHGVLHLDRDRVVKFGQAEGLPSLKFTNVFRLSVGLRVATVNGIYRFQQGRLEPDPAFSRLFMDGKRWVYGLREDVQGRVWMHSFDQEKGLYESGAAVPDARGGYRWEADACRRFSGSWVECLLPEGDGIVWFGTREGLVRLDSRQLKAFAPAFQARVRKVVVGKGRVLFGGAKDVPPGPFALARAEGRVRFEFASPGLGPDQPGRCEIWLEGFEKGWAEAAGAAYREYTNLAAGHYRFHVRWTPLGGEAGREDVFAFQVLPPWYTAWWAWLAYLSGAAWLLHRLFHWRVATLRARNLDLQAKVAERTRDLELQASALEAMDATVRSINREVALGPLLEAMLHQSLGQFPGTSRGAVVLTGEAGPTIGAATWTRDRGGRIPEDLFRWLTAPGAEGVRVHSLPAPSLAPGPGGALMALDLPLEGRTAGWLILEAKAGEAFGMADAERLGRFREHLALALLKAQVVERLDRSAAQLRDLNDQKNQFLGIVAHDLRNPLNGIVLAAQLLEGEDDPREVTRIAGQILAEGRDMSALIGRFLDIAAIESGAMGPTMEAVAIRPLVESLMRRHALRAREKRLEVRVVMPDDPGHVHADGKFLKEVLDNLLSNALKFSPPERSVVLRMERVPGRVRLSVEDEGPGLTAEDMRGLFGRFTRLSAKPTGGEKSTGLGLSIVKSMVEAMGGAIWAESTPGFGASFRVELEAAPEG